MIPIFFSTSDFYYLYQSYFLKHAGFMMLTHYSNPRVLFIHQPVLYHATPEPPTSYRTFWKTRIGLFLFLHSHCLPWMYHTFSYSFKPLTTLMGMDRRSSFASCSLTAINITAYDHPSMQESGCRNSIKWLELYPLLMNLYLLCLFFL